LEARLQFLKGNNVIGAKILKELTTDYKSDPRFWVLSARIDLDSQDVDAALRKLEQADKLAPMEIEIMHGLAWLRLVSSNANPKLTMQSATELVHLTAARDWSVLGLLAAAYALNDNNKEALVTLQSAIQIAPHSALQICDQWRDQLAKNERIAPPW
jgi:cytochrome c-type biogenesis protein CcmH/NrfG